MVKWVKKEFDYCIKKYGVSGTVIGAIPTVIIGYVLVDSVITIIYHSLRLLVAFMTSLVQ